MLGSSSLPLPFLEILLIDFPILVHQFWWNAESAKDFDGKMSKVRVTSKDGPHSDEQCCIYRAHNHYATNSIAPGPIAEAALDS